MNTTLLSELRFVRIGSALLIALAAMLLFFFLCPMLPGFPVTTSLDQGWVTGINEGQARGLVFGRDLIFTFGPYASVYTQQFHPATDRMVFLAMACLATAFLLVLAKSIRRGAWKTWVVFAFVFAALANHRDAAFLAFPALFTLWALSDAPESMRDNWRALGVHALAMSALGLLTLVKGSLIAPVVASVLLLSAFFASRGRYVRAAVTLAAAPATAFGFWLIARQPADAFIEYYRSLGEIVFGYTEAMAATGARGEAVIYIAASIALAALLFRGDREIELWPRLLRTASIALFTFMGLKAGFVRHDDHAVAAAGVIAIAGLLTWIFSRSRNVLCLLIGLIAWWGIDIRHTRTTPYRALETVAGEFRNIAAGAAIRLWDYDGLNRRFQERKATLARECEMPAVTGSVDVYPHDQACLIARGLDWNPRPVFQSYSAYTPALLLKNASHLESANAPESLLFRVDPIDGRFPALEDGLSWPVILGAYELGGYRNNYAVLTKRQQAMRPEFSQVATGRAMLGEEVVLESATLPVFAEIDVRHSSLGKLANLAFKVPRLRIAVTLPNGGVREYRFVPGMARTKFLLSPVVKTTSDFVALAEGKDSGARLARFRIFPEKDSGVFFSSTLEYSLFTLTLR